MQKTYDECYLICSTAIYFEGQVCSNVLQRLMQSGMVLTSSSLAEQ